jgi:threonine dehydrogenase-like Zn-dependent dehydrogenase
VRALVLKDWGKLMVSHVPDPEPGDTDVLLEVIATGICGSDVHGYTGETGRRHLGQVMGHETSGRIARLGRSVDPSLGLRIGDVATVNPVLACGRCPRCADGMQQACVDKSIIGVTPNRPAAFAQLLAVPAGSVVALPAALPHELGALVEPLAVGFHAAQRARVRSGDRVLIVGAGPIGQACIIASHRQGARAVAVSDPLAARRTRAETLGAVAVDPSRGDVPTAAGRALGGAPDVVIDAVGSSATLADSFACAPPLCTVVLVGMAADRLELDAYEITTQERSVVGSFCYTAAEFDATARWAGTKAAALTRLIDERVGLDDAPDAFERLAAGETDASKILVCPNSPEAP